MSNLDYLTKKTNWQNKAYEILALLADKYSDHEDIMAYLFYYCKLDVEQIADMGFNTEDIQEAVRKNKNKVWSF